jgi:hypothetical protein
MELPVQKVSFVDVTVKLKLAFACFLAFDEVSCVDDLVVLPAFSAFAMVLVILPLSVVHHAFFINVDTFSVGFAFLPVAPVDIPVLVCHLTFSMEFLVLRHALIL